MRRRGMRSSTRLIAPLMPSRTAPRAATARSCTAVAAPEIWSASGMGDVIGAPASGSDGLTGTSRCSTRGKRHLGRLYRQHRIRALAAGGDEEVMQVLRGGLRVQCHDRVLELLCADHLDQVARAQHERIADRELAPPHVDLEAVCRGQPGAALVLGHEQPRRAHEVAVGIAAGRNVELVAAHDRERDADRAHRAGQRPRASGAAADWTRGSPSRARSRCRPTRRSNTRAGSSRPPAGTPRACGRRCGGWSRSGTGCPWCAPSSRSSARSRRARRTSSRDGPLRQRART